MQIRSRRRSKSLEKPRTSPNVGLIRSYPFFFSAYNTLTTWSLGLAAFQLECLNVQAIHRPDAPASLTSPRSATQRSSPTFPIPPLSNQTLSRCSKGFTSTPVYLMTLLSPSTAPISSRVPSTSSGTGSTLLSPRRLRTKFTIRSLTLSSAARSAPRSPPC